ncbi:TPA: flagellar assembly peptidoglycan hydrolase FlgJ [Salmonella enterica]|uniref:Peptidoglycan hydrolase FlgJ n=1 Tax=Salmonella enterica TaxID=28901 RepID=A0A756YE42_SALER|nr:flagellar assembly peptidoglycan hydrolase FlgJ [Salmonella enterica subsp. enterica serovar Richmond]HAG0390740.1 flagellar assembly peptidoglycan hydrolase FlgJ [Salmonella enterica]
MFSTAKIPELVAFDQTSLNKLKRDVKDNPEGGLKATVCQIEGLFIQMMLKSMRQASSMGGVFDSQQSAMFMSMYDQQIAQRIANTNKLGFANQIMTQFGYRQGQSIQSTYKSPYAPLDTTVPKQSVYEHVPVMIESKTKSSHFGGESFISRLLGPAIEVAQQSGVPHQLIIAQAALESNWGNSEIRTQNGRRSHNLFGIKATPDWKGEVTVITTTEYKNGVPYLQKDTFKVYKSYTDALADYTAVLTKNLRYRHVLTSTTPEAGAKALQSAGYATDPAYAKKLISIIHQIRDRMSNAVHSYTTDLSSLF